MFYFSTEGDSVAVVTTYEGVLCGVRAQVTSIALVEEWFTVNDLPFKFQMVDGTITGEYRFMNLRAMTLEGYQNEVKIGEILRNLKSEGITLTVKDPDLIVKTYEALRCLYPLPEVMTETISELKDFL